MMGIAGASKEERSRERGLAVRKSVRRLPPEETRTAAPLRGAE
jgi:hypothetical protein